MIETIYSDSWDGAYRTLYKTYCKVCKVDKYVPKHILKRFKFCSLRCRAIGQQNQIEVTCSFCGLKFPRQESKVKKFNFCNRKCKEDCQTAGTIPEINPPHYKHKDNRTSYRIRAIRHNGIKCSNINCEITKYGIQITKDMLDVDHINGDRKNNKLENLQVLCVWCHRKKTVESGWEK